MSAVAEQRKVVKGLRKLGYTVVTTGSGHYAVSLPNGGFYILPSSPRVALPLKRVLAMIEKEAS